MLADIPTGTHYLIAAIVFDDDGPSDRAYYHRGTYEECRALGDSIPAVVYSGNRPGAKSPMLIIREAAEADRAAVLCKFMVAKAIVNAPGDIASALPMVGAPAPDALRKITDAMAEYMNTRTRGDAEHPPDLIGYNLGAGILVRSSDGVPLIHITAFVQREDARSVRWDGRIDRAGVLVENYATYEPAFLIAIANDAPAACPECKRNAGTNPGCATCIEHTSKKGP